MVLYYNQSKKTIHVNESALRLVVDKVKNKKDKK